jgi:hypothetical protein
VLGVVVVVATKQLQLRVVVAVPLPLAVVRRRHHHPALECVDAGADLDGLLPDRGPGHGTAVHVAPLGGEHKRGNLVEEVEPRRPAVQVEDGHVVGARRGDRGGIGA